MGMVSCNQGTAGQSTEKGSTDAAIETGELDIVKNGEIASIVYPISADPGIMEIVNSLVTSLQNLTGIARVCSEIEGTAHNSDTIEILIGATGYNESRAVYEDLAYGDGTVRVVGNKIIVAGHSVSAISKATTKLIFALNAAKDKDGNIRISKDYSVTIEDRPEASLLPKLNEKTLPRVEEAGQGATKLTFHGVNAVQTKEYVAKLEQAGYVKHAENKIDNNLYYTYCNDENIVTVIWADRSERPTMSVTVDPISITNLIPNKSENTWTKIVESTFTQIGLHYDPDAEANAANMIMNYASGMCYVMRLEDSSFIVIDGGFDHEPHADHIYELMKKQAADPDNIVVAAWIFSHDHGDHVPFFKIFCEKYADKVTVEKFIHSFPYNTGNAPSTLSRAKTNFLEAKIYKSHAGQKYYLRNVTIEILYTSDLYLTNVESMADTNNASQVFTITANGTKFMMFGDYGEKGATMLDVYSSKTLKSDVMQHAHHGVSDMSDQMVRTVGAEYVFWPVTMLQEDIGDMKAGWVYWEDAKGKHSQNLLGLAQNKYVVDKMDDGTVFVANDDVFVATFENAILNVSRYENFSFYLAGIIAD